MKFSKNLFSKEHVEEISSIINNKINLLNDISEFQMMDSNLAIFQEKFENSITLEQKKEFDNLMKLNYQIEDYYFTLAFYLGYFYHKELN